MAKILFILAPKNFRDEEFLEPKNILENHHKIEIASAVKGECTGSLGVKATATLTLNDALNNITTYAAVIFVGGSGSNVFHDDPTAHKIAQLTAKNPQQILAGICWASVTLTKAGVLTNKNMTGWISPNGEEKKIFEQHHARYQPKDVVVDGNIITANGPHAAHQFGKEILKQLNHA